ncbi:cobalt-precorrin 5A hydrolase [Streptococcus danieliae]|uniref:Cobalamin biosynthesis protein CbiG n=1 Tax=Streptococcus danieliae TaxID=747656 RepID=A0A7Z0S5E1_9STRE|nr:cobalt-precorrin 5A hydrolase [Streptococcus danieliae]MBF0698468.1 cobalt-precorrin 5A hydrolase [Streptococcus danieliae]MVX58099.1 cobalamin biosynthesis protein CbiG [Streptococcus danieliae]NYS95645.1 cobalt-precorrin 5A hydrolase [Streptococcus danieliae]
MMNPRSRVAIVALTQQGKETAFRLASVLPQSSSIIVPQRLWEEGVYLLEGGAKAGLARLFQEVDVLICIMATGIVVRSLASVIKDKTEDPAVLVLDEKAEHVISLISGHLGGANAWARTIGRLLGADPVITTATDVQGVTALDLLAKSLNAWTPALRPYIVPFNRWLAQGQSIACYQEKDWLENLPGLEMVDREEIDKLKDENLPLIILTLKPQEYSEREKQVCLCPKPYLVGVGARKDLDPAIFEEGFHTFCRLQGIDPREVARLVSIDVKKEEKAICQLAERLQIPFETYSKEQLQLVAANYPQSEFVRQTVGVGSVALASADLASHGRVLSQRFAFQGATFALADAKAFDC